MKILVVEDEPGIADFLKQGLEEEGYAVDVAEEGETGLRWALAGGYDLLLLDWLLPGPSGIEICRQVRKKHPVTPIIFLTAKDTVQETIFGLQAGANDYLKKPFNFEELVERIKVQLRPKTGAYERLTLGSITLDTNTYQTFKGDEEVVRSEERRVGKECRC